MSSKLHAVLRRCGLRLPGSQGAVEASSTDNLEHAVEHTHDWLQAIAMRLGCGNARAPYGALRAVLHLIRDRLPIAQSAALGARLPLMIRGIYYEDWRPHAAKPRVRHVEEFLGLLERELDAWSEAKLDPQQALDAVFARLRAHLEPGEVVDLIVALPSGMRLLLDEARRPAWLELRPPESDPGIPSA
jgi:uncharacterized protein (DUF2267 family)